MKRVRVLAALATLGVAVGLIGNFAVETLSPVDVRHYDVSMRGARWIVPPDTGPRSWFRLPLTLDRQPDAVSIWIDGAQTYVLYVNGHKVDSDQPAAISDQAITDIGNRHGVDLTSSVVVGSNVIGLVSINYDDGVAAVRARVTVVEGGTQSDFVTGTAPWKATSDVIKVESPELAAAAAVPVPKPASAAPTPRPTPRSDRGVPLLPFVNGPTPRPAPGQNSSSGGGSTWGTLGSVLGGGPALAPTPTPAPATVPLASQGITAGQLGVSGALPSPGTGRSSSGPNPENGAVAVASAEQERALFDATKGLFSLPRFDAGSWRTAALRNGEGPGAMAAAYPDWVIDEPLAGQVITSSTGDRDLVAAITLSLDHPPQDGWVRVAATGTASIFLDGEPVVAAVGQIPSPPPPPADLVPTTPYRLPAPVAGAGTTIPAAVPRTLPKNVPSFKKLTPPVPSYLSAYHIGPLLHSGGNVLAVRVSAAGQATLYLDGHIGTGAGDTHISTGPLWGATSAAAGPSAALSPAPATPALALGPPSSVWGTRPTVVVVSPAAIDRPSSMLWGPRAVVAVILLGAWLLIALVTRRPDYYVIPAGHRLLPRASLTDRLCAGALGALPGALLTFAAADIGGVPNLRPPSDHTVPVLALLVMVTIAGDLLCSLVLALGRQRPAPAVVVETTEPPAREGSGDGAPLARRMGAAWLAFGRVARPWQPALAGADGSTPLLAVAEGVHRPGLTLPDFRAWVAPLWLARLGRAIVFAVARRWPMAAVGVTALGAGAVESYRIDYEPFWQDELYTLMAGQGIRQHVVPEWPSGFLYWKAEFYDILVAGVGRVFGDTTSVLRMMSVVFFVATVLAFGLLLAPAVLGRGRPWLTVGVTALFATAPAELVWAREARMYQLAQLFVVVFMALYLRALREPTTRRIGMATAALLLMYLSHEESFIVLPGVILVGALTLRWSLFARSNRPWLYFGGLAAAVIAVQYTLAFTMKPNYFGSDLSNRPFIVYDTTDAWYYLSNVYFNSPGLGLVSSFAIVGMVVGLKRRDFARNFVSAFLVSEVFMLSDVFTMRNARYAIISLPPLFLLSALGVHDVVDFVARLLTPRHSGTNAMRIAMRVGTRLAAVCAMLLVAASMAANVESYGLLASRVTNAPYIHKYRDYSYVVNYVLQHEQPGDLFMTVAPPIIPSWYMGRAPDMIIPGISDQRLLKIFERDGRAVDSLYGVPVILAPTDLVRVLEQHHRVWLVTDDRYVRSLPPGFIDILTSRFRKVDEGAAAALYLGAG